jgi:hypothetical protein
MAVRIFTITFLCLMLAFLSGFLYGPDSLAQEIPDTLKGPAQAVSDSITGRRLFVMDSLRVREQFVQDSINQRLRMIDSLNFLRKALPRVLEAYLKTYREEIIWRDYPIPLVGDSTLGDYACLILPFSITQPFTPWMVKVSLQENVLRVTADKQAQVITAVQTPFMKCSFTRNAPGILVLRERSTVQKNGWGQFYTSPVDSVFYDRFERVVKIKRYTQVFAVVNGNQRGTPLFINLTQVKQFTYGPDRQLTQYQVVKFCDRWKAGEGNKVCSIITYAFSSEQGKLMLTRRNDPANSYSDGIFGYIFDDKGNLTGISFQNLAGTEQWERTIELNQEGNVHCYFDKIKGVLQQSLCMIYHPDASGDRPAVETITTTFEKDGISYYQHNNTTGRSRTRDRMTLEWSPWQ